MSIKNLTMLDTNSIFVFVFFSSVFVRAQYVPYPGQVPYPYQNVFPQISAIPKMFPQHNAQVLPLQNQMSAYPNIFPQHSAPVFPPQNAYPNVYPQQNQIGAYPNVYPQQNQISAYPNVYPQQNQINPYQNPFAKIPAYPPFYPGIPKAEIIDVPTNGFNQSSIPVEIIDIDENGNQINSQDEIIDINEIKPEITTLPSAEGEDESNEKEKDEDTAIPTAPEQSTIHPLISGSSIQHYSSNINNNNTKGIQIYESKPINTVIRRTIHSNGKDGRHVLNIHVINGVEVTSEPSVIIFEEVPEKMSTTTEKEESEEEEDDKNPVDNADPKPVLGWFN